MINKKGFTIVELLVVIALIGLLIIIAVPSGLAISKKIKVSMMDSKIELIEKNAIVWGQQNLNKINGTSDCPSGSSKCITKSISELLDLGAISADEVRDSEKVMINPISDKDINDCKVTIYVKNRRVYANYNQMNNCYIENTFSDPQEGTLIAGIESNTGKNEGEIVLKEIGSVESLDSAKTPSGADEQVLVKTVDNDGTTYIYRGNVDNNYINFAGMCWRIVRINGDNSIKIILEDQDQTCSSSMDSNWDIGSGSYGYNYVNGVRKFDYVNSSSDLNSMVYKFQEFQQNFNSKLSATHTLANTLKSGGWCVESVAYINSKVEDLSLITSLLDEDKNTMYLNKTAFYYGSYVRLDSSLMPTLNCESSDIINNYNDEDKTPMYVGTLTIDEVRLAGAALNNNNMNGYLYNSNEKNWWTLSPAFYSTNGYDYSYYISNTNRIETRWVTDTAKAAFRPAVNLLPEVKISGTGTITDPFVVE